MQVTFGEFSPDLPPMDNTGVTVALNVLPSDNSYKPFPSQVNYSLDTIDERCQGAASGRGSDGTTYNFAGDDTKLYRMSAATWSDVSKVGGYTTGAQENWNFTQWGKQILATNFADDIQEFTMGTSSVFADLSATAPRARHIDVVRSNVVVANTYDATDGAVPYRVRWSAVGDATAWTPSVATQSDFQDLDGEGGWCQKVVGGEVGTIFQERSIWRMTYVGSPIIYQFDEVERGRGTPAPGSVTKIGSAIPYLGIDGFYIFDGQQSVPIGVNRIDKTFYADLDQSYMDRICSTIDPINQIIFWASPGQQNFNGNPNRIWAYNYSPNAKKRWAYADEINVEYLYRSLAEGYTLDGLDAIEPILEDLQFSLDSRVWTGNSALLSAFNTNHRLTNFTGSAMEAIIETQEAELTPNERTNVGEVRVFAEGAETYTVEIGTRNFLYEDPTWSGAISPNSAGAIPCRANARYHRIRVNLPDGFTSVQGMNIARMAPRGRR